MKTVAVLSLAAAAIAAPAPQSYPAAPVPFSGITSHSGSSVHLLPIVANDRQIWLNKPTSTYCPEGQVDCQGRTNGTLFVANNGGLSMDVEVPGGQQAYVTPAGQLKYTGAHSATMEQGSSVTGFSNTDGHLLFENSSWYACPADGAYNLYAASKSSGDGCTGISFVTEDVSNAVAAWQYT